MLSDAYFDVRGLRVFVPGWLEGVVRKIYSKMSNYLWETNNTSGEWSCTIYITVGLLGFREHGKHGNGGSGCRTTTKVAQRARCMARPLRSIHKVGASTVLLLLPGQIGFVCTVVFLLKCCSQNKDGSDVDRVCVGRRSSCCTATSHAKKNCALVLSAFFLYTRLVRSDRNRYCTY